MNENDNNIYSNPEENTTPEPTPPVILTPPSENASYTYRTGNSDQRTTYYYQPPAPKPI